MCGNQGGGKRLPDKKLFKPELRKVRHIACELSFHVPSQILPASATVRPNSRGFAAPPPAETNRPGSLVLPPSQPYSSLFIANKQSGEQGK